MRSKVNPVTSTNCNCKIPFLLQSGVHHALNPDPYRGVFGSDGEKYAKDVQDVIDFGTTGHVAGFISESIQVIIIYSDFY